MDTKHVGIADLKAHLSEHLRDVRGGHALVIVDRGRPIAKVLPIQVDDKVLTVREPRKPFAEFPFSKLGLGTTNSLAILLEDRHDR
jgi:prevent-host-death family protein